MADKSDFSFGIEQDYMRHTLHTIILRASGSSTVKMLDLLPALGLDMLHYSFRALIDADTDDADFVSPTLSVLFKQFLIVSHRSLARRAPSGPEVNQDHLAWLVLYRSLLTLIDVNDFFNRNEWTAH
jgi:hypothetical protein